jgi:hypothetical protein
VEALVSQQPWRRSFPRRLLSLLTGQRRLARSLVRLRAAARREGLAPDQTERLVALARGAHRAAVGASHYEDVRAVLSTWRYLHRWLALLLLLLVALHVTTALRYADLSFDRVPVVRWFVGGAGS